MRRRARQQRRERMANKLFNIDDPGNVNSFLALIGGSQVSSQPEPSRSTAPTSNSQPEAAGNDVLVSLYPCATGFLEAPFNSKQEQDLPGLNSSSQSVTASPTRGINAPPPTPATGAVAPSTAVASLEHIEQDGSDILRTIANTSNLNLNDSIHAPKNYRKARATNSERKCATMPTRRTAMMSVSNSFAPLDDDQTSEPPGKKSEQEKFITRYQDEVIAKFVREKSPESESNVILLVTRLADNHFPAEKKPEPQAKPSPILEDRDIESTVPEPTNKVTQSTVDTPDTVNNASHPKMVVTAASEDRKDDVAGDEEDRERLKHFSSWGKPKPRSRPAARVRKIILSNLPADSDLTLVQSLVYGGTVEAFNLMSSKASAYVIFVNADVCDAFFNAHPNGIVFKNPKTRRNHVVYVDKNPDVDVVSSVLQAYLDCQASRVVRATGADEDWGMRALYKLAESKNRKVEKIVDTYRDQVSLYTCTSRSLWLLFVLHADL